MKYSYSFTDSLGTEYEDSGTDLTALAESLSVALTEAGEEGRVKIYDEPGFTRGWAKAGEWHLS